MATVKHYSWWWNSHISPKNSKWLQENLTDIDTKVKAMIKIINEDADSFARRAEMYYKKRPELMKLVEEFYRAYRALAERYDHATGELRIAHRTMIEAFPNQASLMSSDDTPSGSEPIFGQDDSNKDSDAGSDKSGLKHLNEMFQTGEAILRELKTVEGRLRGNLQGKEDKDSISKHVTSLPSEKSHSLDLRTMILNESERAANVEAEMRRLKQALAAMEVERDAVLVQYRESLEKSSNLEKELNSAQIDAEELDKRANEAQSEVKVLRESLQKVEAERDSSLVQFKEASSRLTSLEAMAESDSQNLKQELCRSETEKHEALAHYQQSLEKISALEEKLQLAEVTAKSLCEQNEQAEGEVKALREELSRLCKEKEDAFQRYEQCLDMIAKLQKELLEAKEEVNRLNSEVLLGSTKLKGAEDQCALLEKVNQSLKLEANDLVQEIAVKDQLLSEKHTELEKFMSRLQDEHSRFMQVEASLQMLQNMHLQSQEDQRALALELRNGLQMLRDLELRKRDLEVEIQSLREENQGLNDLKVASSLAENDMQHEISSLKEIKERLEAEVRRQAEQNGVLQQQFRRLKEEMEDLYKKYQDLLEQVVSVGLDPKCLKSSIEDLKDENSRLKQMPSEGKFEKEALLIRLEEMEGLLQKSAILESSLSDVKVELESSKEKMKALQISCDTLVGEKSNLTAEKSALLSQLQIITESMQKLLANNVSLENSLQGANIELEGLRVKSRSLEEFCQFLKDERSVLQTERSSLVYRLECVEKNLEKLETRFTRLEDKYAGLEKERDSSRDQVEELKVSLGAEKQERECLVRFSDARLSGLENCINHLQEENRHRKKDFEEQLEKAVNAQVEIFILQKFVKDMEERNYTLLAECQKHAEAAKFSEKIISELESENMMQHLETEYLLDRVDSLRRGICQVLKALEIDHVSETDPEIFVPRVRGNINDFRRNLSESKDENQQLLIQNNVLSAVVSQLVFEGLELKARKEAVDHEFFLLNRQHVMLENEKDELLERSKLLEIVVAEKERGQEVLKDHVEVLNSKQQALEKEYVTLQKEHSDVLKASRFLKEKISELKEEKNILEEENSATIVESLSLSTQSVVLKSSWVQKALESARVAEDMCCLQEAYSNLGKEARKLGASLNVKETENTQLRELIQLLEEKNLELSVSNDQLSQQCLAGRDQLNQKEAEFLEAEHRVKTTQDLNTKLNATIEGLEVRCRALDVSQGNLEQQVFELSECKEHQESEIVLLREANGTLESEVAALCEEIEACKIREVILSSELHERNSESELWEAEATSFYFDLQMSSVREALLENKVCELSGWCEDLEDASGRRTVEIEKMQNKINLLETESEGLKSSLAEYVPAIASLKDKIASLEQTPALQTKVQCSGIQEKQVSEFKIRDIIESSPTNEKEQGSSVLDGLSELRKLQTRVKTIESILVAEKNSALQRTNTSTKLEDGKKEIEKLKMRIKSQPNNPTHDVERKTSNRHGKSWESRPATPEMRNGTHMKDIQLDHISRSSSYRRGSGRLSDQMLELWDTSELESAHNLSRSSSRRKYSMHRHLEIGECIDSNPGEIEKELGVDKLELSKSVVELKQGGNRRVVLEKLTSDAEKLASLQTLVEELRRKIEIKKKRKSTKDAEHKRLKGQLQDVENSVLLLVEMNTTLTKTIKESPSSSSSGKSCELVEVELALRRKMLEQARKDSERIASLQLEMQKIQSIMLSLEDEKANTSKLGRNRSSRSRTGIILREFVYGHGRIRKQKKSRFCGCFRPSQKEV